MAALVLYVFLSVAGENRIATYQMDPATGKLSHASDIKLDGDPGALATDPGRRYLFASFRSKGRIASFRIDPRSGRLTLISTVEAGADPAYLATDRTGRFLLCAYYVAGKVTVHEIGKDGSLGKEPLQSVTTAKHAHAVLTDAANRFAYVPHTSPNTIFQFTFEAQTGRLTPQAEPTVIRPEKSGPRHLVFHPKKPLAYVDNEQGNSVTSYEVTTNGGLKALDTVSTLPQGFQGSNATADIEVHPSGRFVYCSNRGHDSIACFAVDETTGQLKSLGQVATEKTPREFNIDPTGKFLYAAGEGSGKLAAYRIKADGLLERFDTYEVGKRPWWVMVVAVPQ